MIPNPAMWRAGRPGMGRLPRPRRHVTPAPLYPVRTGTWGTTVAEVERVTRELTRRFPHGRTGALYCGSGDAPPWKGDR